MKSVFLCSKCLFCKHDNISIGNITGVNESKSIDNCTVTIDLKIELDYRCDLYGLKSTRKVYNKYLCKKYRTSMEE